MPLKQEALSCHAIADGSAAGLAAGFTHVRCVPSNADTSMRIHPDVCIAWAGDGRDVEVFVNALER